MCLQAKRLLKLALCPVLMLLSLFSTGAWAEQAERWQTNMTPGITEVGHQIYDLHMWVFYICVVTGIVVFGVMFYSVFAYRKERHQEPATFHENTKVEIAWTIVPFLVLLFMAIPATNTLIEIYDTDNADLDILITGYRWKWKYEYINPDGDNISYFSNLATDGAEISNTEEKGSNYLLEVDEPLVIPVNKKVRFLVTANDVLHAWWVPALAVKRDAIPGFINEAWTKATETGVFRGQCAELCGRSHGFMPIVVNVVEESEYVAWLSEKQADSAELKGLMSKDFSLEELVERGKSVYVTSCSACHGANGEGGIGNAIAGSPIATGPVKHHIDRLVNGVAGTSMPAFGSQFNELDIAAVITYQRNSFGNNMGDMLQPVDIYNYKKGQ